MDIGVTPGVDGVLERTEGQQLAVNVDMWHPLQYDSDMLYAMEHPLFCCDRRLGDVLMPNLGHIQDHQRATAFGHYTLATVVLK